jgi:hypothetical protein
MTPSRKNPASRTNVVARKVARGEMRGHKATTLFVRFRRSPYRLQVSIVETRRVGGKVRHEHIVSLGSIDAAVLLRDNLDKNGGGNQSLKRRPAAKV